MSQTEIVRFNEDLRLDGGGTLPIEIAYRCYGTLNAERSNVILICHTFTGDQHPTGDNPITGKQGWWADVVGKGCPLDTDRYFVICQNVLGGCAGTTGPASINPETDTPYGSSFPIITIGDMVRAQAKLLDHLDIPDLFCVIGGSMGGMQVLQWASAYGERVFSAVPIASSARHSPQNIALHEVCRQVIQADPDWRDGTYYDHDCAPHKGLAVARMAAHITYLSEAALQRKFGRNLQDRAEVSYGFEADFQVESYLRHQGASFATYFDANSYLYITRAMDYFDLAADHKGQLALAFTNTQTHFCVMSFSSDWLFPTRESVQLVRALNAAGARVSFVEIESDKGHDAFLLDEPEMFSTLQGFLDSA
ncbi:MAG: homoserine O-acetyltransferase, partial [Alphaproteobacteria bacterium]|nr:homoserine O-acetyltransferase [Alphaproteobacteria bacterium]